MTHMDADTNFACCLAPRAVTLVFLVRHIRRTLQFVILSIACHEIIPIQDSQHHLSRLLLARSAAILHQQNRTGPTLFCLQQTRNRLDFRTVSPRKPPLWIVTAEAWPQPSVAQLVWDLLRRRSRSTGSRTLARTLCVEPSSGLGMARLRFPPSPSLYYLLYSLYSHLHLLSRSSQGQPSVGVMSFVRVTT